jgi:hypothetical protein
MIFAPIKPTLDNIVFTTIRWQVKMVKIYVCRTLAKNRKLGFSKELVLLLMARQLGDTILSQNT